VVKKTGGASQKCRTLRAGCR